MPSDAHLKSTPYRGLSHQRQPLAANFRIHPLIRVSRHFLTWECKIAEFCRDVSLREYERGSQHSESLSVMKRVSEERTCSVVSSGDGRMSAG